ncbi:MAG: hypothetical protein ABIJ08_03335 [Nanoarchaeota archaeon]
MKDIANLVQRVYATAGFEVFVHAADRIDLNDWTPREGIDSYVKAVHNLVFQKGWDWYGSNLRDITDVVQNITDLYPSLDVVAWGPCLSGESKKWSYPVSEYEVKKKRGFWGLLGCVESVPRKIEESGWEEFYTNSRHLSDVVGGGDSSDAYFIRFIMHVPIHEITPLREFGRYDFPTLTIIGNKELILDIAHYLKTQPIDYLRFLESVLNEKDFPRVNKGIVKKVTAPAEIYFIEVIDSATASRKNFLRTDYNSPVFIAKHSATKVKVL